MPDLANLSISDSPTVTHCPNIKSHSATTESSVKALAFDRDCDQRTMGFATLHNANGAGSSNCKSLEDHVRHWVTHRMESGIPETRSSLPFLCGAKTLAECLVCHNFVCPGDEILCSVRGCQGLYHQECVKGRPGISNTKKFTCPQHVCFICRQRLHWRCVRCTIASHDKCAPWPDKVMHLIDRPGRAVCWRHPADWWQDRKHAVSASNIEEVFFRLPLPYTAEEFKIDLTWKHTENNIEPPPYTHIRRNIYLVKKKRDDVDDDVGCRGCTSVCSLDCVCRVQCISCSKACHCSENCTNRPFLKEKKIRIVKTAHCGWGAEAAESVKKGDFIIEYIGEVINDALCEQRLWDMKYKEVKNFYMCEIRKDFTIDATFKGNPSRFLNHSCDPNCVLEKWQVEGETRVGVFAARSIEVGEPLTYDYRFVQFGPEVKCCCGASNCQGYLGIKKKICKVDLFWGKKRKRTPTACIAILR
ncbi:putative histone-lysine N-methyltransferase transcription regulator SET family [Rosa chinensis]|uniref:Putative histone-lysine N-methyltransferase transcription regulator SET family n=1 Tax=Rosa chinensis TaxID=74649 RepID=A0A2P6QU22_ROSCH|nr:histone-lysine N-methyltransferase ASHR3 [Rosa chinensis]PRQ37685.1 putative histone-lysine N-methyltransferase transcription regulator SET family [Rosa chinensis]